MFGYYIYLLFVISYFIHLSSRIPLLGFLRFDLFLMIIIFLCMVSNGNTQTDRPSSSPNILKYLVYYIVLSLPFVVWPGSVIRNGVFNYSKVIFFFYFTISFITTEKRLRTFIFIFLACQIFRVLEPAYLHYADGYWGSLACSMTDDGMAILDRLSGAPHDIVNPNQLAWVLVNTIPFIYYLLWKGGKGLKLVSLSLAPIFIYVLLLTGSRSGLLSLFVVILTIMLTGKHKGKQVAIGMAIVAVIAAGAINQISSDLKNRYLSIIDSKVAGGDSAAVRIRGLEETFLNVFDAPIFGHGLGTTVETNVNLGSSRPQPAHNLYIEVLQELGLAGFIIFDLFIKSIIMNLIQAKRILTDLNDDNSWLLRLISAVQVWIVMDIFYSMSCFGFSSWEWYLMGGITVVCLELAENRASSVSGENEAFNLPKCLSGSYAEA